MSIRMTAQAAQEWAVQRKCGHHDEWGDATLELSEKLGLTVRFNQDDLETADEITMAREGLEVRTMS